MAAARVWNSWK